MYRQNISFDVEKRSAVETEEEQITYLSTCYSSDRTKIFNRCEQQWVDVSTVPWPFIECYSSTRGGFVRRFCISPLARMLDRDLTPDEMRWERSVLQWIIEDSTCKGPAPSSEPEGRLCEAIQIGDMSAIASKYCKDVPGLFNPTRMPCCKATKLDLSRIPYPQQRINM